MSSSFISYAQNSEDVVIWRALGHVEGGFFIDVGAADPIGYSVTYSLYLEGWRGLNIEPEPNFAAALRKLRPSDITIEAAVGDVEGSLTLRVPAGTGLSTADPVGAQRLADAGFAFEELQVPVRTLAQICEEHCRSNHEIHLLKVDVEGLETQVLTGMDFGRWRPWVVVVEATEPMSTTRSHERWEPTLLDNGYEFKLFDGLNRFYLAVEHAELSDRLDHGPCIFDGAIQRADVTLSIERHRGELESELREARSDANRSSARIDEVLSERDDVHAEFVQASKDHDRSAAEADRRIAEREQTISDLTSERDQVITQIAANRATATEVEADMRVEIASLQQHVEVVDDELAATSLNLRETSQRLEALTREHERLVSKHAELQSYADLKDRERIIVDDQLRVCSETIASLENALSELTTAANDRETTILALTAQANRSVTQSAKAAVSQGMSLSRRTAGRFRTAPDRRRTSIEIQRAANPSAMTPDPGEVVEAAGEQPDPASAQDTDFDLLGVADQSPGDGPWGFPRQQEWSGPLAAFAHHLWGAEVPSGDVILEMIDGLELNRDGNLLARRFAARERSAVNGLRLAVSGRSTRSDVGPGLLVDARCISDARFARRGIGRHAVATLGSALTSLPPDESIWLIGNESSLIDESALGGRHFTRLAPDTPIENLPLAGRFLSLSPSTEPPAPQWLRSGSHGSAVVYDLIPWQFGSHYFPEATDFVEYVATLVWLRSFDRLWAISSATADHACETLGIPPERFSVTGVESPIGHRAITLNEPSASRQDVGGRIRIALCGGGDARKNLLTPVLGIRAAAQATASEVIGVLPEEMSQSLERSVADFGPHVLRVLGSLTDDGVSEAYRRSDLVVVPSYAEGFSLPVAEGVNAGRPVLASDIPAHRELLGDGPWLVEPSSPRAWLAGLERFVRDGSGWHALQEASLEASKLSRTRVTLSRAPRVPNRVRTRKRPSLAILTPLPPQESGIADYSVTTLAPLSEYFDVTLIANDYRDIDHSQFAPVLDGPIRTAIDGGYDHVLHVLGDSHFHIPTLEHLEMFGGSVLTHDMRMVDVYAHWQGDAAAAEVLSLGSAEVRADEIPHLRVHPDGLPDLGYGRIAERAEVLFVHSPDLAQRVAQETGVESVVLPFSPYRLPAAGWKRPIRNGDVITVATFGSVTSVFKRHDLVIEALAWLVQWGFEAKLVCVGEANAAEWRHANDCATRLGLAERLTITGRVSDDEYRSWLERVDVAVQVRNSELLGLSGAVVDAIAYGAPVVTTDAAARTVVGAPGVTSIPNHFSSYQLAAGIVSALDVAPDAEQRRFAFLEERSAENYARAIAETLLGLSR